MGPVLVKEELSGLVRLRGVGLNETYVPDCDLEKARQLLLSLYALRAENGRCLKENFHHQGFNWLSGLVNHMWWRFSYRMVQYEPLIRRLLESGARPLFVNKYNLVRLWELLRGPKAPSLRNRWRYRHVLPRHNRELAAAGGLDMLFFRYGPDDFRTREFAEFFQARGVRFASVFSPSKDLLRRRHRLDQPVYFLYRDLPAPEIFTHRYDTAHLPPVTRLLVDAHVARLQRMAGRMVAEYTRHLENLERLRPRLFFGVDDRNHVYPLLFACKTLGIPSLGYQFGMAGRYQQGYVLEGWEPEDGYQWYDRDVLWGAYWEEVVRRWSKVYPPGYFLMGANKTTYSYKRVDSADFHPRNVLVPYEIWGNTKRIGEYIKRMIDLGYTVHFKYRPDEDRAKQLDSYDLGDYAARLVPVERITDELMGRINIVAGTMTTLIFDLLPYGKQTWILETEFPLLMDMVDSGLARLVRLDDLETIDPARETPPAIDHTRIYNPMGIERALEEHVLSRL